MQDRFVSLENVAMDLPDDDLKEVIIFAAYLKYRRRIINLALQTAAQQQIGVDGLDSRDETDSPEPAARNSI